MFEFLIEIESKEFEKYLKDPKSYTETIEKYIKSPVETLDTVEKRVNYWMARAVIGLVLSCPHKICIDRPMYIASTNKAEVLYLWTSLMLLGSLLRHQQFDHKAIRMTLDIYSDYIKQYQVGYFSRFSSSSLYEKEFVQYLNKEAIERFLNIVSSPTNLVELLDEDEVAIQHEEVILASQVPNYEPIDFVFYARAGVGKDRTSITEWHLAYKYELASTKEGKREKRIQGPHGYIPSHYNGLDPVCRGSSLNSTVLANIKNYAALLFRLRHEVGYGAKLEAELFRLPGTPITLPLDGVLIKKSGFFSDEIHYSYTPGLEDCKWVEAKNKKYLSFLVKKKIMVGKLSKEEETDLLIQGQRYPAVVENATHRYKLLQVERLEKEKTLAEKNMKETEENRKRETEVVGVDPEKDDETTKPTHDEAETKQIKDNQFMCDYQSVDCHIHLHKLFTPNYDKAPGSHTLWQLVPTLSSYTYCPIVGIYGDNGWPKIKNLQPLTVFYGESLNHIFYWPYCPPTGKATLRECGVIFFSVKYDMDFCLWLSSQQKEMYVHGAYLRAIRDSIADGAVVREDRTDTGCSYEYTPGPEDCKRVEKNSRECIDHLVEQKMKVGKLSEDEENILCYAARCYPDLVKDANRRYEHLQVERIKNEKILAEKNTKEAEEKRKRDRVESEIQRKKDSEAAEVRRKQEEEKHLLELNQSLHNLFMPNEFGMIPATISKIEALLEQGANIDFQEEKNGRTILMLATEAQNDQLVNYLLEYGANPLLQDKKGNIASSSRYTAFTSLTRQMLKGYELLFAVKQYDIKMAKLIIRQGADIDFKDSKGYTALIIAVKENDDEMVVFLLSQNVRVFLELDDGENMIKFANPKVRALIIEALNPPTAIPTVDDDFVINEDEEEQDDEESRASSPRFK